MEGLGAQLGGKWIFGHQHSPCRPKGCKNDCPPGALAELSSPIFTFGMGHPLVAAVCAASQVFASGSINRIFGARGCRGTPNRPDLASLVPCSVVLSCYVFGFAHFKV